MEIKTEISDDKGRRFNSLGDAVQSASQEQVEDILSAPEKAARAQVCPVHGHKPTVRRVQQGNVFELRIDACCDDAADHAEAAAAAA
jgi:hypothetical protein